MKTFCIAIITLFFFSCASQKKGQQTTIKGLRLIGEYILPNNTQFNGTTVGGLSSIDYSPENDVYYFICDDRADISPMRFYTAKISLDAKGIKKVEMVNVTSLQEATGRPFHNRKQNPLGVPDPEALRYDQKMGRMIWSSEGERTVRIKDTFLTNPAVYISSKNGAFIDTFFLPENMHMKATPNGPRNNGVFEGLTFSNNFKNLYVSVEEPLYEDGYRAGLKDSSAWVRFIKFDIATNKPVAQYAYEIDPVQQDPVPAGSFMVNGVTDILALNDRQLLVTERSFSNGKTNNNIRVYLAELTDAQDISSIPSLKANVLFKPMQKKLVLNMDKLDRMVYNIEGATFGPLLPNGRRSLIFVSDNNFDADQKTQFLLFEVE